MLKMVHLRQKLLMNYDPTKLLKKVLTKKNVCILYMPNEERLCKICGKKLRPLLKQDDWEQRVYHVTCFNNILKDLTNFGKTAYTKYGYKRKFHGLNKEEAQRHVENGGKFKITFD